MGFLDDLGFGELISSVNELRGELEGLRDDVISSVTDAGSELGSTVEDISNGITGENGQ